MDNTANFEKGFASRLQTAVQALPPGVATLQIGPEIDCAVFRISPANPNSAIIEGEASTQGGIAFRVGQATIVELSTREEDRFFQICQAVFTSHFNEFLIYGSKNRVLYSRMILESNGRKVRLGGHQLFWWLFPHRRKELLSYVPY